MTLPVIVLIAFGIWCEAGGVIGYVKAKSLPSLITGALSGVIFLVCAYGLTQQIRAAAIAATVMALLLGGRFAMTWCRTRRLMPDAVMVLFSLVTFILVAPLVAR